MELSSTVSKTKKSGVSTAVTKQFLTRKNISMAVSILCCLLIGSFRQLGNVLAVLLLLSISTNIAEEDFYVYAPLLLLFWDQFRIIGDITAYRGYSYLTIGKFLIEIHKARFRGQFILPLAVFISFLLFAAMPMNAAVTRNLLIDTVFTFIVIEKFRAQPELMRKMALVFCLTSVCAGVYSITAGTNFTYMVGIGAQDKIIRYVGTVGDPNYAGLFFDLAIFMALTADSMKKWYVRVPLMAALYVFMFMTNSMTALGCNVMGLCIYFVCKLRLKSLPMLLGLAFGAVAFVWAILYVPALSEIDSLRSLGARFRQQMTYLQLGRMDNFSTGRTDLWDYALHHFNTQPLIKKLIGGNVLCTNLMEEHFLINIGAAHQTYLQGLLNFGVLGLVIIVGMRVGQFITDFIHCLTRNESSLPLDLQILVIMCAFSWLFYAFTIDYWLDWRFTFFYFL